MRWLLDVNVNRKLIPVLKVFGMTAESSIDLGWRLLTNGDLIESAVGRGFQAMLTNDVRILDSGGKSLSKFPEFGLVLLRLPQVRSESYLALFKESWTRSPIVPKPGGIVSWPG